MRDGVIGTYQDCLGVYGLFKKKMGAKKPFSLGKGSKADGDPDDGGNGKLAMKSKLHKLSKLAMKAMKA